VSAPGRTVLSVSAAEEDRNRRLLRARDLIDRRSTDPLDVDALAAVAFMARSHFIREFKATFGETPHRYLQRRRIERAMTLLRTTDTPVTDVCMAVGFSSLGTFSRTFRDVVGTSPRAFRQEADPATGFVPTAFRMRWTRPAGERGAAGVRPDRGP
jgi:AraC-like DNA-binding protein